MKVIQKCFFLVDTYFKERIRNTCKKDTIYILHYNIIQNVCDAINILKQKSASV